MAYRKYKLGDLVEQYDEINQNGEFTKIEDLQGINSNKYFQECKSNKNDIDLLRYRICRHGMFSYNRATSRNGEKISIALRTGDDCLVSPSYYCFRIKDEEVLCPEYLDIWFKRPVFDKYARFNSWGSATEFFTFDDFCATEIMLPPLPEQRKIIHDYKVITDRIELLRKINENLVQQGVTAVQNKVQGSDRILPFDEIATLFDFLRKPVAGADRANLAKIYPYYGAAALMDYIDEYIFDGVFGLIAEDGSVMDDDGHPTLQYVWGKFWVNNHAHIFQGKNGFSTETIYLLLKSAVIRDIVTGAVQLKVNQENLRSFKIPVPEEDDMESVEAFIQPLFSYLRENTDEIERLSQLADLHLKTIDKGA